MTEIGEVTTVTLVTNVLNVTANHQSAITTNIIMTDVEEVATVTLTIDNMNVTANHQSAMTTDVTTAGIGEVANTTLTINDMNVTNHHPPSATTIGTMMTETGEVANPTLTIKDMNITANHQRHVMTTDAMTAEVKAFMNVTHVINNMNVSGTHRRHNMTTDAMTNKAGDEMIGIFLLTMVEATPDITPVFPPTDKNAVICRYPRLVMSNVETSATETNVDKEKDRTDRLMLCLDGRETRPEQALPKTLGTYEQSIQQPLLLLLLSTVALLKQHYPTKLLLVLVHNIRNIPRRVPRWTTEKTNKIPIARPRVQSLSPNCLVPFPEMMPVALFQLKPIDTRRQRRRFPTLPQRQQQRLQSYETKFLDTSGST